MTEEEMKNKYSAFITEISDILGLGKPVDIIKLCTTTDLFFQPLKKRIEELEEENAELKADRDYFSDALDKQIEATLELQKKYQKLEAQVEKMQEKLKADLITKLKEQMQYSTSPSCTKGMELFIKSIEKWEIKEK